MTTSDGTVPGSAMSARYPEFFRPPLVYPDVPFHEMLARTVLRVPERPAIYWHDVVITYREMYAMVRSAAIALNALGLRKGDRICLLLPNRPEYVITWFAASMLGLVVSPMNPSYKQREVAYQLQNTEAAALLVHSDLLPVVREIQSQVPSLKHVLITGNEDVHDAIAFGRLLRSTSPGRVPVEHGE